MEAPGWLDLWRHHLHAVTHIWRGRSGTGSEMGACLGCFVTLHTTTTTTTWCCALIYGSGVDSTLLLMSKILR
eukprot:508110-Pelagomonas_calceolata.AAC.1